MEIFQHLTLDLGLKIWEPNTNFMVFSMTKASKLKNWKVLVQSASLYVRQKSILIFYPECYSAMAESVGLQNAFKRMNLVLYFGILFLWKNHYLPFFQILNLAVGNFWTFNFRPWIKDVQWCRWTEWVKPRSQVHVMHLATIW